MSSLFFFLLVMLLSIQTTTTTTPNRRRKTTKNNHNTQQNKGKNDVKPKRNNSGERNKIWIRRNKFSNWAFLANNGVRQRARLWGFWIRQHSKSNTHTTDRVYEKGRGWQIHTVLNLKIGRIIKSKNGRGRMSTQDDDRFWGWIIYHREWCQLGLDLNLKLGY